MLVLIWFGITAPALAARMRSDTLLADASPSWPHVTAGAASLFFLVVAVVAARRLSTGREDFAAHRVGPIVVFLVQGAGFVLLALGIGLTAVARAGHAVTTTPDTADVTEGQLFGSLVWQASRAVPVVELPASLGWENPIPDPAWPLGLAHVAVRALFAGVLLSTVVLLWRTWRKQSAARSDGPPVDS
jgi:hypothetical protein